MELLTAEQSTWASGRSLDLGAWASAHLARALLWRWEHAAPVARPPTTNKQEETKNWKLEQETDGYKIDEKLDQIKTNRDQTFHRPSQGSW